MGTVPGHEAQEPLPVVAAIQRRRLLRDRLRGVSRTFYLTIRVLPSSLGEPVGLAYLLARAADTIADTRLLPPGERLGHLLAFRQAVAGPARLQTLRGIEAALSDKQSIPQERELLASLPSAFSMLEALREPDRTLVRSVVVTLTRGMEADLTTFPGEESGLVAALGDAAALDQYIYYVAGCVGEFWTAITMAYTASLKEWDAQQMSLAGVRFGKALQLTNVLRDVPRDLSIGRCYLPRSELSGVGITPEELRNPSLGPRARPVLAGWIVAALGHYAAAEEYLLAIPRRCLRLRLAVLWPMLIGLATLARLARNESWLDPARPSRVSRRWIYRMLALSWLAAGSDQALRAWIRRLRRRVEEAI